MATSSQNPVSSFTSSDEVQNIRTDMGITLEQNPESASQILNTTNSTEREFGEDFEYTVKHDYS